MLTSESIREFPQKPGAYLFKDKSGKIIYIGKAKNLRKRINSYFAHGEDQSRKLSRIIRNSEEIEHIITATETEALILEGNLIKKHRPRYNVVLRDDKRYPSLCLDVDNPFPRLFIVRKIKKDGLSLPVNLEVFSHSLAQKARHHSNPA